MPNETKLINGVFEGGGVKGSGLAGAVKATEEYGYQFQHVAGTSAGAIVAALIAAGYSGSEMKELIESVDYSRLKDEGLIDKVPFVGFAASLMLEKGIYEGRYFEEWIEGLLAKKNIHTFRDLAIDGGSNADGCNHKYKLRVIASDISRGKLLVLPQDIADYGIEPDDFLVARALRMSMSIPYFYEPVVMEYKGQPSYIVDGGVLSNFPVWLFDDDNIHGSLPTFGYKLVEPNEGRPHKINGPITLLTALFSTMMEAHDARHIEDANFLRTIPIPTLGVRTTDFKISLEQKQALYQSGYQAGSKFCETWDFERYKEKAGEDK